MVRVIHYLWIYLANITHVAFAEIAFSKMNSHPGISLSIMRWYIFCCPESRNDSWIYVIFMQIYIFSLLRATVFSQQSLALLFSATPTYSIKHKTRWFIVAALATAVMSGLKLKYVKISGQLDWTHLLYWSEFCSHKVNFRKASTLKPLYPKYCHKWNAILREWEI